MTLCNEDHIWDATWHVVETWHVYRMRQNESAYVELKVDMF